MILHRNSWECCKQVQNSIWFFFWQSTNTNYWKYFSQSICRELICPVGLQCSKTYNFFLGGHRQPTPSYPPENCYWPTFTVPQTIFISLIKPSSGHLKLFCNKIHSYKSHIVSQNMFCVPSLWYLHMLVDRQPRTRKKFNFPMENGGK